MNGFKYRSNNTVNKGCLNSIETFRDEESLFNDEIYASDFKHLNDPFEATYIDSMDGVFALMNRLGFDKNASLQETWHHIQAFRDNLGVFLYPFRRSVIRIMSCFGPIMLIRIKVSV